MSGTPDQQENSAPGAVREALAALKVALTRTRQSLLFEKIWPVAVSLAAGIGIFLAISWAGLWIALPPMARIAGLVLLVALVAASLFPAIRIRLPGNNEAVRRLEQSNASTHRPATALTDRIASKPDPMAEALWREHVARTADAAKKLRATAPRPQLALRDPMAFRALILLGVVVTFFVAEGHRMRRAAAAFDWTGALPPRLYRVDAWVAPPQYTARAPVLLTGIRHDEAAAGETPLVMVPTGSTLIVRATNLANLDLAIDGKLQEEPNPNPQNATAGIERHFKILEDASVTVRGLPSGSVTWHFRAIPDRVPVIELLKNPEISGRNAFSLNYKIEDDYGVTSAEAKFERVVPAGRNTLSPRPLVNAPDFPLILPQARTKSGTATTARDLTEHPWAGAVLRMTLHARDEGGNTGVSQAYEVTVPQRSFEKPLARALIEQRRELAFDANARGRVQRALDALMIAPDRFTTEANVYLGLRTASTRLRLSRTDDDLRGVIDYLWEIAVLIEDGTLSDVERDLRAAENALKQALERGASEEEIKKLMDQLRAALEKYLQALAEQQNRQSNDNPRPDANVRTLRPQDLKNMLDRIERMARQGDLSGAQKLLSELQSLMQNLQRNRRNAGPQQDQNTPLDQLGRMIQEQQRLRDRTFRQGRENPRGDQQQKGQGQKQQRQSMRDLQKNQGDLRQQLEQMLEQLRKRQQGQGQDGQDGPGKEAGEALNRAEQAMRDAEDALGNGDAEGAVDQQGRALQSLRQGAQAMADAMQGPGDGPGDPNGPEAEAAERTDPLGRPTRNRDFGDDYTVKVPDEIDAQRARRVLEELRRRLSDPNRPRLELEYLDRLLRE
ncbi:MAG TPA: TIGR02302 family protein [Xanthobacteraceae bacterium]|nr:TIGR02302 family protein [Xanthobacteraceae bacterium]